MDHVVKKAEFFLVFFANEDVFERAFADLALKVLPDVRIYIQGFFTVPLTLEPFFETA